MKLPQVIISGDSVPVPMVADLGEYSKKTSLSVGDTWCHPDGTIGYLDTLLTWKTQGQLLLELKSLAQAFPSLVLGVSLMSGATGEYNTVVVSWLVKDGTAKKHLFPHMGHAAPSRWKAPMPSSS